MRRLAVPFILLLAVIVASVASDRALPRADVTFINSADVTTLDPQRMSWMQDLRLAHVLYEGLVVNDPFTWGMEIRPGVAERWDVTPDGKTYTFHLRADAKWSNGERVRASDFVFSWRRALLPDLASDYTGMFQLIRGGEAFFAWRTERLAEFEAQRRKAAAGRGREGAPAMPDAQDLWARTLEAFDGMVGLRAVDDATLVVELERAVPYFLDLCAFGGFSPVYPALVERYERPDAETGRLVARSDWTKPPKLVSNGPFRLAMWRFKRDKRFELNEHYWNRGEISVDSINVLSVEDQNARVLAYNTGAVDLVSDVAAQYRPEMLEEKLAFYAEHKGAYEALKAQGLDQFEIDRRLPEDRRKHVHAVPAFGTYFFNFNCLPKLRDGRPNPFYDPRVRRAFAMAVDKQGLIDTVVRLGNPVAGSLVPPNSLGGYTPPKGLPYDPAAARRLLAEAGHRSGFPIVVEILFNKDAGHDKIAEFLARNWQDNLGVQVRLEQKEITVFKDDVRNANYIVSRGSWYGDYGDPTTFLDLSRTGDGNNDRKYSSPAYDALLAEAAKELDAGKRMRILEEAERMIMEEDLPILPVFHYVSVYLFDPHRISGFAAHPRVDQHPELFDVLGDGKGRDVARVLPARPAGDGR
jgi:oligopeptide transport system substrate-binding protein